MRAFMAVTAPAARLPPTNPFVAVDINAGNGAIFKYPLFLFDNFIYPDK
jgi:hypothetical protein